MIKAKILATAFLLAVIVATAKVIGSEHAPVIVEWSAICVLVGIIINIIWKLKS